MFNLFTGKTTDNSDKDGKDMASNKETVTIPEKVYIQFIYIKQLLNHS